MDEELIADQHRLDEVGEDFALGLFTVRAERAPGAQRDHAHGRRFVPAGDAVALRAPAALAAQRLGSTGHAVALAFVTRSRSPSAPRAPARSRPPSPRGG